MIISPLVLLGTVVLILLIAGYVEASNHRRIIAAIPLRIHVNGTRGKSSVTRLIAAGLRAGGLRTFAKTTGTAPRIINAERSEEHTSELQSQ